MSGEEKNNGFSVILEIASPQTVAWCLKATVNAAFSQQDLTGLEEKRMAVYIPCNFIYSKKKTFIMG